jgi:hypothetical protein
VLRHDRLVARGVADEVELVFGHGLAQLGDLPVVAGGRPPPCRPCLRPARRTLTGAKVPIGTVLAGGVGGELGGGDLTAWTATSVVDDPRRSEAG